MQPAGFTSCWMRVVAVDGRAGRTRPHGHEGISYRRIGPSWRRSGDVLDGPESGSSRNLFCRPCFSLLSNWMRVLTPIRLERCSGVAWAESMTRRSWRGSIRTCRRSCGVLLVSRSKRSSHNFGQQPPDFLILAARALSSWSSGTSPKQLAKHSSSFRWKGVLAGASE